MGDELFLILIRALPQTSAHTHTLFLNCMRGWVDVSGNLFMY